MYLGILKFQDSLSLNSRIVLGLGAFSRPGISSLNFQDLPIGFGTLLISPETADDICVVALQSTTYDLPANVTIEVVGRM